MQRTIDQLTASAPHLIGALVILIVGYLVARGLGHMTLDAGGKDTFLRPVSSTV